MKHNMLTIGVALSVIALLTYGESSRINPPVQAEAGETNVPHLEGTWRVIVTPPPGAPSPPYISYGSYTSGGVLITSPDPSVGPGVTSTGLGTWVRTGGNEFASTHVALTHDAAGQITGAIRIKASYQLTSKDSFEGSGQLQFCDLSLNNCFTPPGCPILSNLHGERIIADPPSCPPE
jgi:hypothetical protein